MPTFYGTNRRDVFDGGSRAERVFGYAGDDDLYGNGGDDILYGDDGDDLLVGGLGNDRLYGGRDDDILAGEEGDDTLDGGAGFDAASYAYARAAVSVNLAVGTADDGEGGRDRLVSIEDVYGSRFDDRLTGSAADNILSGAAGNDRLDGDAGQDLLIGGTGADRFIFDDGDTAANAGDADLIDDFFRSEGDRIDLRLVDANEAVAGDQAFRFVGTAAFSGTAGEVRYAYDGLETLVYADTDGDRAADAVIRLDGDVRLVAGDFLL